MKRALRELVEQTKVTLTAAKEDALLRFNATIASITVALDQHQVKTTAKLVSAYDARMKVLEVQADTLTVTAGQPAAGATLKGVLTHDSSRIWRLCRAHYYHAVPLAAKQGLRYCSMVDSELTKRPATPIATAKLDLVCNTRSVLTCLDSMTQLVE